ncbi:MAG: 50S ribosomal protein L30 [Cyanobacteria bacterium SZAS LIN-5]|jgi:large subunit ribosomal protein L30|nr:50S ribosomal protein L30 [Cyanobacteria bacterium SZAS LIN-5]RTL44970.1 MAG: 50S ribosomal protein L30 [Candidatus Melainabacteria bacterium]
MLKITLTSGLVAKKDTQIKVIRALGLGKFGSSVVHADTPTIRGMITKVSHLVTVEKEDGKVPAKPLTGHRAVIAAKKAEKPAAKKTKAKAESK